MDSTKSIPQQPLIKLHFQYSDTEETTQSNNEMIAKVFNEFQDQLNVRIQSEAALIAKVSQKQQRIVELKSKLQQSELENTSLKNQVTLFVLKQNIDPNTVSEMPMVHIVNNEAQNSPPIALSMDHESPKSPKVPTINQSSTRKEPEPRRSPIISEPRRQSAILRSPGAINPQLSPNAGRQSATLRSPGIIDTQLSPHARRQSTIQSPGIIDPRLSSHAGRQSATLRSPGIIDQQLSPHAPLERKVKSKIRSLENSPSKQSLVDRVTQRQAEEVADNLQRNLNESSKALEDKKSKLVEEKKSIARTDSNLKYAPKTSGVHSIFTKVQAGLFQYEILPYIAHPRDILVLKCLNKVHSELIKARSGGIVLHYQRQNENMQELLENENLQEAIMALDTAKAELNQLQKADVQVIKSMAKPPADTKIVMDMVVWILTGNEAPTWTATRRILGDAKFLQRLKQFDKESVPRSVIVNCREIIRSNKLNEQRLKKLGKSAIAFFKWVHALVCIYHNPKVQEALQIKADIQQALDALKSLNADLVGTLRNHKRFVSTADACRLLEKSRTSSIPRDGSQSAEGSEPASPRQQPASRPKVRKFSEYSPKNWNFTKQTSKILYTTLNLTEQQPKPAIVPRVRDAKPKTTLRSASAEAIRPVFGMSDKPDLPNLNLEEVERDLVTTTNEAEQPILPGSSMFDDLASPRRAKRSKGWKGLEQRATATFDSPRHTEVTPILSGWNALMKRSLATFDEPAKSARNKRSFGWNGFIKPILGKKARRS